MMFLIKFSFRSISSMQVTPERLHTRLRSSSMCTSASTRRSMRSPKVAASKPNAASLRSAKRNMFLKQLTHIEQNATRHLQINVYVGRRSYMRVSVRWQTRTHSGKGGWRAWPPMTNSIHSGESKLATRAGVLACASDLGRGRRVATAPGAWQRQRRWRHHR